MPKRKKREKRYIIQEVKVDEFTTIRQRKELTRDVCNMCGFSVCDVNGLPPYDALTPEMQARVVGTLESHKAKAHTMADKRIVTESQMPTEWLNSQGGGNKKRPTAAQAAVEKRRATMDDI